MLQHDFMYGVEPSSGRRVFMMDIGGGGGGGGTGVGKYSPVLVNSKSVC